MSQDGAIILRQVFSALQRRAYDEAHAAVLEMLSLDNYDSKILSDAATACKAAGRYQTALPILELLSKIQPDRASLLALYACQTRLRLYEDAIGSLEAALAYGKHPSISLKLAKLKTVVSKPDEAERILAEAHADFPDNVPILLAHASDIARVDPTNALERLENRLTELPHSDRRRIDILRAETELRCNLARSQMAYGDHPSTWLDLRGWSDPAGLQRLAAELSSVDAEGRADENALTALACIAACNGDIEASDQYFRRASRPDAPSIIDAMWLNSQFLEQLESVPDSQIESTYPPVEDLHRSPNESSPPITLSSDPVYFWKFTLPVLGQCSSYKDRARIHIHLLDGEPALWKECVEAARACPNIDLSMTAETSGMTKKSRNVASIYYHATRLVRVYQYMRRHNTAVWMFDVDINLHGDIAVFADIIARCDLAFSGHVPGLEPWNKIGANCIGIAPTEHGLRFAKLVAAYIAHARNQSIYRWGLDQAALYAAYAYMMERRLPLTTTFLPPEIIDRIGLLSGHRKFA